MFKNDPESLVRDYMKQTEESQQHELITTVLNKHTPKHRT